MRFPSPHLFAPVSSDTSASRPDGAGRMRRNAAPPGPAAGSGLCRRLRCERSGEGASQPKRCCAAWRVMPRVPPIASHVAPASRALRTAASRLLFAAARPWFA